MLIHDDSMAIIFNTSITFNVEDICYFGFMSRITDLEGILHHIANPSGKKSSLGVPKAAAGLPRIAPARIPSAGPKA